MKIRNQGKFKRIFARTACMLIIIAAVLVSVSDINKADIATDTVSIRVGYFDMPLSEYVETASFTWYEMEDLAWSEDIYSYFQGSPFMQSEEGYNMYSEYNAIVDVAHGIYLSDLIDMAHIYYGDIYNMLFWVDDHNDIWSAFDRDNLFAARYYYENLSGHRHNWYNDGEQVYAYSFESAANWAYPVDPMLAFEDNWIIYNEQLENSLPDDSYFNTGSRFRLLFGQEYAEEVDTRRSAKYVSRIYVTLWGSPTYVEEALPEIDGTIGSHTVEMKVSIDEHIRDALSELMWMESTNENVLVITGMEVIPDSYYEDVVNVVLHYDIVGEGEAGIYGGAGSQLITIDGGTGSSQYISPTLSVNTADYVQPDPEPASQEGEPEDPSAEDPDSGGATQEAPDASDDAGGEDATADADGTSDAEEEVPASGEPSKEEEPTKEQATTKAETETIAPEETVKPVEENQIDEAEEVISEDAEMVNISEALSGEEEIAVEELLITPSLWKLSYEAGQELSEMRADAGQEMAIYNAEVADQDIEQLQVEDTSEEDEEMRLKILKWTAIISGILMVIGGVTCLVKYKIALKTDFPKRKGTQADSPAQAY